MDKREKEIRNLLALLQNNPDEARKILKVDSWIGHALLGLLQPMLTDKEQNIRNLPKLLSHYLRISNTATVLCLGSGTGIEFMAVRRIVPQGRIIGIDNSNDKLDTSSTVVYELAAQAEFYPYDLNSMKPEQVVEAIGTNPPEAIIVRHPNTHENHNWSQILANWGNYATDFGSQLLITTFYEHERLEILRKIQQTKIPFILDQWNHGDRIFDPKTGGTIVQDKYILGIGIGK